jgi:dihydroxyacetone kinase-like predicted kinase
VLFFDAMLAVVDDRPLPDELELPPDVAATVARSVDVEALTSAHFEPQTPGSNAYEVMFLLEADDAAVERFKDTWAELGDSIVVVGGDGTWNCHIHTDDIGGAIEAGVEAGHPRAIRVSDLREQVEEEQWVRSAGRVRPPSAPARTTAVVAVAVGEGISRIFRSLGVDQIVAGGQSMNPSTAEILAAVEAAAGHDVVVLPNNSNVIASARQAAELTGKSVSVLATNGMQEAFAALLEYDPQATGAENATTMAAAAARVVAGEVTRAVRDVESPVGPVRTGDFIGLSRRGVESVGATAGAAACALIDRLIAPEHEVVTLIEGRGADPAETKRILEYLAANYEHVTIERHHGGQPLYPFLVAIE